MIDSFSGDHAFLSNYYPSVIGWEDTNQLYPTMEHYFQAMKTFELDEHNAIMNADTPGKAKRLGRQCTLRADWEAVKDQVMLTGLRMKFSIPELKEKLLATEDEFLVEGNYWKDTYWGLCEGKGRNKLGFLLMQVREEIQRGLV